MSAVFPVSSRDPEIYIQPVSQNATIQPVSQNATIQPVSQNATIQPSGQSSDVIGQEFLMKDSLLSNFGVWTSPDEFYAQNFHLENVEVHKPVMMIIQDQTFCVRDLYDILSDATILGVSTWHISMAEYFEDALKKKLMNILHAVVFDLDRVRPNGLSVILETFKEGILPMPTYLVNSGSGIHLYYTLDQPLRTYSQQRRQLDTLLKKISKKFRENIARYAQIDIHWSGQPYRIVGSKTKFGKTVSAYQVGDLWNIKTLAKKFSYNWRDPVPKGEKKPATDRMIQVATDLSKKNGCKAPNFDDFSATYKFIGDQIKVAKKTQKCPKNNISTNRSWYERTIQNIISKTREGNRYTSLLALAAIARKTGIDKEDFATDIQYIADLWCNDSQFNFFEKFKVSNLPSILRFYDKNYAIKVTRVQLEEWLGWNFSNSVKRNGRTQKEHLERARRIEKIDYPNDEWINRAGRKPGTGTKKNIVKNYLIDNPNARKCDVIRGTGLSKATVLKWFDIVQNEIISEENKK